MQIITGYTGESHVTSADDASLYRGILGRDDYVLDVGNKFAATIIDNNTVRIMDGDLVIQGHQARIRANDYEKITIDNGTPGEKRNDLIVARYQKNTTTGIESITLEVVKGTPGETATDPEIIQEDLTIGGIQRDYPLYRVSLNGLVLESVTSLFTVLPNFEDFMTHLADYSALGKIEYVYIPEGTQTKFDVPLRTSLFFVLTENNDNKTTIINVTRFGIGGLVYQTVVSGSVITIHTNADRSAVFLTPEFAVRGFVVRARQPI